jgi:ribosome-associated toxin RatA of RatAB toxin-antitoxin module
MSAVERSAAAEASPDAVWAVLADYGAISGWVPMIQHSCLLSEQTEGVGAVRRVQIVRQTLVERIDTWAPPRELAYTIEGLPPMVGRVRNTWRITPTPAGCDIVLTTEIDTGRNPAKALIARKVLERMSMASEFMLAGLAAAVAPTAEQDEHEQDEHEEEQP